MFEWCLGVQSVELGDQLLELGEKEKLTRILVGLGGPTLRHKSH